MQEEMRTGKEGRKGKRRRERQARGFPGSESELNPGGQQGNASNEGLVTFRMTFKQEVITFLHAGTLTSSSRRKEALKRTPELSR